MFVVVSCSLTTGLLWTASTVRLYLIFRRRRGPAHRPPESTRHPDALLMCFLFRLRAKHKGSVLSLRRQPESSGVSHLPPNRTKHPEEPASCFSRVAKAQVSFGQISTVVSYPEQRRDIKQQEETNFPNQELKVLSGTERIVSVVHVSCVCMLSGVDANFLQRDLLFLEFLLLMGGSSRSSSYLLIHHR